MNPAALLKDPVLSRDGFRCVYCGADLLADVDAFVTFTRDHVTPLALGGPTHPSNLVTACAACNRLKSGRPAATVDEGKFVIDRQRGKWQGCLDKLRRAVRSSLESGKGGLA